MKRISTNPRLPNATMGLGALISRLSELFRDLISNQNALVGGNVLEVTTTEKNAMTDGTTRIVFDTTLGKLCVWTGAAWETITSV